MKTGVSSSGVLGPEMWGVITTFANRQSGWWAGSGSVGEDVEDGAADPARLERVDQRALVDHRTPGDVHQPGPRAHGPQLPAPDHPARLRA